jgi:hypothetical protein
MSNNIKESSCMPQYLCSYNVVFDMLLSYETIKKKA